jgi:hypothetical protein
MFLSTCIGAIRRLRLEFINTEVLQEVLVVKYFGCNRCGIEFIYNPAGHVLTGELNSP